MATGSNSTTAVLCGCGRRPNHAADGPTELLRIAWHLGNRHLPLQIVGNRLRIHADHVIAEMVTGLGGRITCLEVAFDPEAGAYAGPAPHHHDHDPNKTD